MLTVGRYHEVTRMDGFRFRITNDDTGRILCHAKDYSTLMEKWIPIYGRYTLEYTSRVEMDLIEYHIRCGMTVNDHISMALGNDKTIGVKVFDIRDEIGNTIALITYENKFNAGEYALYPVKSRRVCFDKIILKTTKPPIEGYGV